jgi:hypothetical protein
MADQNTSIDPKTVSKGTRVRIAHLPGDTAYAVTSVERPKGRFYAVSEDGKSGHWFNFTEISEIVS